MALKVVELPYNFKLRWYQQQAWHALHIEQKKQLFLVWHRRAGKDDLSINILASAAMREKGNYAYILPEYSQARKVVWQGIAKDGTRFIDRIPSSLITGKPNNQQMLINLINGSTIQLAGSNNVDSLMGTNFKGIIYSEFSLQTQRGRQYLRPILVENGGWELMQCTPRGMNHAYHTYKSLRDDPDCFTMICTVKDTYDLHGNPIVTRHMIETERKQGVPEEIIQSEYYCDFESAVVGAYYAAQLRQANREGRIDTFPIDKRHKVYTSWDIGHNDATAIWFFQLINGNIIFIHYYEKPQQVLAHFAQYLKDFALQHDIYYAEHIAPHDMKNTEWGGTGKTRFDEAYMYHNIQFTINPRARNVTEEIDEGRKLFIQCYFNRAECEKGIEALTQYHTEYKVLEGQLSTSPKHDWSSHAADAFRAAVMWYTVHRLNNNHRIITREMSDSDWSM